MKCKGREIYEEDLVIVCIHEKIRLNFVSFLFLCLVNNSNSTKNDFMYLLEESFTL